MTIKIYHNPRCTKSRQTFELLQKNGVKPEVIEYLKTSPDATEIKSIVGKLGIKPVDLLRKKEAEYKEAGLTNDSSDGDVIAAMAKFPKLIERPIVINGEKAAIGRPPESVLEII